MEHGFERKVASWFGIAAIVTICLTATSWVTLRRSAENIWWVEHTHEVLFKLQRLGSLFDEGVVAVRGYALMGDERFLESYRGAFRGIDAELEAIRRLTADNSFQQTRIKNIEQLIAERRDGIEQTLDARRRGGVDAYLTLYLAQGGESGRSGIRDAIAEMEGAENRLLNQRSLAYESGERSMFALFLAEAGVVLAMLLLAFRSIGSESARRSLTEQRLRTSQKQFNTLADSIPQLAWMTRPDGYIFWYNQRWFDYTGTTLDQVEGWGWQSVHDPAELPRVLDTIKASFASGEPWDCTFPLRRHDGVFRWHLSRMLPVKDEHGRVLQWFGSNTDVTEQKQVEAMLRQAKETAEAASRAKGQFLANVSHEIRTPMNAILGMTELTLDSDLTSEQRVNLGIVRSATDSLLAVINDVLDFSKIEAGKLELDTVQFEVRDNLEDMLVMLGLRAHAKGIELACRVDPKVPDQVLGDPARLRQILVNLVGNAIKFTEQGEVAVELDLDDDDVAPTGDEIRLHFRVIDTGIGIATDKRDAIFAPFTQADGSTTRLYGGTGLGLAITSQLVGLMGGRIWIEGELGRGSTFHFTVNLIRSNSVRPAKPASLERDDPDMAHSLSPRTSVASLRILVAEDNPFNQRVAVLMLAKRGHSATVTGNGRAALAALGAQSFDLVLMDLQMPEMDGFAATAAIRAAEAGTNRHLPIIAMTAHAMKEDRSRCLDAGMDGYISKPIQQATLERAIEDCIRSVGMTAPTEPSDSEASPPPMDVAAARARLDGDQEFPGKMALMFVDR